MACSHPNRRRVAPEMFGVACGPEHWQCPDCGAVEVMGTGRMIVVSAPFAEGACSRIPERQEEPS